MFSENSRRGALRVLGVDLKFCMSGVPDAGKMFAMGRVNCDVWASTIVIGGCYWVVP